MSVLTENLSEAQAFERLRYYLHGAQTMSTVIGFHRDDNAWVVIANNLAEMSNKLMRLQTAGAALRAELIRQ